MDIEPAAAERHRQLFKKASDLVFDQLPLHGKRVTKPGFFLSRRLRKALHLLDEVLSINPGNWSALWVQGMVLRRLARNEEALARFRRAAAINPTRADILREAGITAGVLGQRELALEFAIKASNADPHDAGLLANVALDALLLGRMAEAVTLVEKALAKDPSDRVTKALHSVTTYIANGHAPCPTTLRELERLGAKLAASGAIPDAPLRT